MPDKRGFLRSMAGPLWVCTGLSGLHGAWANDGTRDERLHQFLAPPVVPGLPDRGQERTALLQTGEAALARLNGPLAQDAFERAARIEHAADTEISLVRTHLQAGEYRRALVMGAHTAGVHGEVIGGATLYAWLLHVGGQPAMAQRILAGAEARMPGNAMVAAVRQQLDTGSPVAHGLLLLPPSRFAPYGETQGLPEGARTVGSAVLMGDGTAALVPLRLLPVSGKLWLRNGLGQLVSAMVEAKLSTVGVAWVRLSPALPVAEDLVVAANGTLGRNAAFAVTYVHTTDAQPAWPVMRSATLAPLPEGAVFDSTGRLTGIAVWGEPGAVEAGFLPIAGLREALRDALNAEPWSVQDTRAVTGPKPHGWVEKIYETALKTTLQVITAP